MLKDLARRLGAGLAATVLTATAAAFLLMAAAFALYAALRPAVGPAGAAASTALASAVAAGLVVGLAPRAIAGGPRPSPARRDGADADVGRSASQIAMALLGVIGDLALSRSIKRREKAHHNHPRR